MRDETSKRLPLNRDRIVEAALAQVDEHGIDGLNMRRLGRQLGVDPMAIYHHLPNKDALLDGIVECLWRGVKLPERSELSWQDLLHQTFLAVRERLLAHPRAAALIGTRPAITPAMLDLIDGMLARLSQAGLPASEAMPLIDCLSAFTVGKVLPESADWRDDVHDRALPALQALQPEVHPHLANALATGYQFSPDQQFDHGVRALIAGWPLRHG